MLRTSHSAQHIEHAQCNLWLLHQAPALQEAVRATAYHEAGHALVALHTAAASPLHKATVNPRGHALGATWQMPHEDEYQNSYEQSLASIDVCMGGTVAERLVFGPDRVGLGATSDLEHATAVARHLVCECGFSEEIGPMKVDGRSSPWQQHLADKEVRRALPCVLAKVLMDAPPVHSASRAACRRAQSAQCLLVKLTTSSTQRWWACWQGSGPARHCTANVLA